MKTLDIIIPVYKSKQTLEALIARLNEWVETKSNLKIHVVFIEDGSGDGTYEFLLHLKNRIRFSSEVIRLMRNYGQHTAISTGLSVSESELVVIMDDDLQHDPFEIDKLIEELKATDADLVYGVYKKKQHNVVRNLSSRVLKRITKSDAVARADND
ncbi:glycosyltransferase, group 2 family protein [Ancylostoma ceylanicum]|uniref:Glycosyltransferase, group 2 family protein n=1 Tax=Ancylostoma ceylanicum TaxID=53326 RepID=A0A0D6LDT0_9BILA|nr:glycosyltransferase, group 2 family protein [Ancylostoma ceylanicum]